MTPAARARFFTLHKGICYLCERRISPGEAWEVEHELAEGLGGKDTPENRRLAHKEDCHKGKTRRDVKMMRKADRCAKKHTAVKTKPPKRGIYRKVSGQVVHRNTGRPV